MMALSMFAHRVTFDTKPQAKLARVCVVRRTTLARVNASDTGPNSALTSFTEAVKRFGAGLLASVIIARPSTAFQSETTSVFGDLAGLEANPVTNARALLMSSDRQQQIRDVQKARSILMTFVYRCSLRGESSVSGAYKIVSIDTAKILASVAPEKLNDGKSALAQLQRELEDFKVIVNNKDKQEVPYAQQRALALVGQIEEDMVKEFPFTIPSPYETPTSQGPHS